MYEFVCLNVELSSAVITELADLLPQGEKKK